ncbi:hypothetical protein EUB83_24885, partial [Salmonella enterica subsp. enterica serovar Kentucky]|nr:hypothetical protein [Salmonella enterica subsp. enterica serovar Kentucky]
MMSLWDALRMNMMISYQELVRTFPNTRIWKEKYMGDLVSKNSIDRLERFHSLLAGQYWTSTDSIP